MLKITTSLELVFSLSIFSCVKVEESLGVDPYSDVPSGQEVLGCTNSSLSNLRIIYMMMRPKK